MELSILHLKGPHVKSSKLRCISISDLANSADTDEMQHNGSSLFAKVPV